MPTRREQQPFQPAPHIVWSTRCLDPDDPWQWRWYVRQVLVHGRAEDVARLPVSEIQRLLPELALPDEVRQLWESYLAYRRRNRRASQQAPA